MVSVNNDVRAAYNMVKDALLSRNYGMKAAMLEAKKRILQNEREERSGRSLQADGFFEQLFEAMGNSIGDSIALTDLEHQLNALIVEDVPLL